MDRKPRSDGREHLPGLDVLRGLLVLFVTIYHLSVWTELFPSGSFWNMTWAKAGNYSVSAFFILSGFLLFRLSDWENIKQSGCSTFYFKRWLRIAPIFYLACSINVMLKLGMGPAPHWTYLLQNVTLSFGFFHPNSALVAGGWYVGLVVLLYLAFPWLAYFTHRFGWRWLAALTVILWLWSLPLTLQDVMSAPLAERFHRYVLPQNQLFLLSLGALLGTWHRQHPRQVSKPLFGFGLALFLLVFLRTPSIFHDHLQILSGWARYQYVALMAGLVFLFAMAPRMSHTTGTQPFLKRFFQDTGRFLSALGRASYATYLLHPFIFRLVVPELHGWKAFGASLLISFCVGALAEKFIERPIQKLGKKPHTA